MASGDPVVNHRPAKLPSFSSPTPKANCAPGLSAVTFDRVLEQGNGVSPVVELVASEDGASSDRKDRQGERRTRLRDGIGQALTYAS